MQKKKLLIPLAIAAMTLPVTAGACSLNGCESCTVPACCAGTTAASAEPVVYSVMSATAASAEGEILRQVNAYRAQYGLSALTRDPLLDQAAAVRAAEIAQKFSHTRPDGRHWSTVSERAYGENIARGHRTADKAMAAWMTSSGHRATILRSSYGSIGIAAVQINGVMHWVQLFGR